MQRIHDRLVDLDRLDVFSTPPSTPDWYVNIFRTMCSICYEMVFVHEIVNHHRTLGSVPRVQSRTKVGIKRVYDQIFTHTLRALNTLHNNLAVLKATFTSQGGLPPMFPARLKAYMLKDTLDTATLDTEHALVPDPRSTWYSMEYHTLFDALGSFKTANTKLYTYRADGDTVYTPQYVVYSRNIYAIYRHTEKQPFVVNRVAPLYSDDLFVQEHARGIRSAYARDQAAKIGCYGYRTGVGNAVAVVPTPRQWQEVMDRMFQHALIACVSPHDAADAQDNDTAAVLKQMYTSKLLIAVHRCVDDVLSAIEKRGHAFYHEIPFLIKDVHFWEYVQSYKQLTARRGASFEYAMQPLVGGFRKISGNIFTTVYDIVNASHPRFEFARLSNGNDQTVDMLPINDEVMEGIDPPQPETLLLLPPDSAIDTVRHDDVVQINGKLDEGDFLALQQEVLCGVIATCRASCRDVQVVPNHTDIKMYMCRIANHLGPEELGITDKHTVDYIGYVSAASKGHPVVEVLYMHYVHVFDSSQWIMETKDDLAAGRPDGVLGQLYAHACRLLHAQLDAKSNEVMKENAARALPFARDVLLRSHFIKHYACPSEHKVVHHAADVMGFNQIIVMSSRALRVCKRRIPVYSGRKVPEACLFVETSKHVALYTTLVKMSSVTPAEMVLIPSMFFTRENYRNMMGPFVSNARTNRDWGYVYDPDQKVLGAFQRQLAKMSPVKDTAILWSLDKLIRDVKGVHSEWNAEVLRLLWACYASNQQLRGVASLVEGEHDSKDSGVRITVGSTHYNAMYVDLHQDPDTIRMDISRPCMWGDYYKKDVRFLYLPGLFGLLTEGRVDFTALAQQVLGNMTGAVGTSFLLDTASAIDDEATRQIEYCQNHTWMLKERPSGACSNNPTMAYFEQKWTVASTWTIEDYQDAVTKNASQHQTVFKQLLAEVQGGTPPSVESVQEAVEQVCIDMYADMYTLQSLQRKTIQDPDCFQYYFTDPALTRRIPQRLPIAVDAVKPPRHLHTGTRPLVDLPTDASIVRQPHTFMTIKDRTNVLPSRLANLFYTYPGDRPRVLEPGDVDGMIEYLGTSKKNKDFVGTLVPRCLCAVVGKLPDVHADEMPSVDGLLSDLHETVSIIVSMAFTQQTPTAIATSIADGLDYLVSLLRQHNKIVPVVLDGDPGYTHFAYWIATGSMNLPLQTIRRFQTAVDDRVLRGMPWTWTSDETNTSHLLDRINLQVQSTFSLQACSIVGAVVQSGVPLECGDCNTYGAPETLLNAVNKKMGLEHDDSPPVHDRFSVTGIDPTIFISAADVEQHGQDLDRVDPLDVCGARSRGDDAQDRVYSHPFYLIDRYGNAFNTSRLVHELFMSKTCRQMHCLFCDKPLDDPTEHGMVGIYPVQKQGCPPSSVVNGHLVCHKSCTAKYLRTQTAPDRWLGTVDVPRERTANVSTSYAERRSRLAAVLKHVVEYSEGVMKPNEVVAQIEEQLQAQLVDIDDVNTEVDPQWASVDDTIRSMFAGSNVLYCTVVLTCYGIDVLSIQIGGVEDIEQPIVYLQMRLDRDGNMLICGDEKRDPKMDTCRDAVSGGYFKTVHDLYTYMWVLGYGNASDIVLWTPPPTALTHDDVCKEGNIEKKAAIIKKQTERGTETEMSCRRYIQQKVITITADDAATVTQPKQKTTRKSKRKSKRDIEAERKQKIENAIRFDRDEGMRIVTTPTKGRGVVATKPFKKGDFVVEYHGDLIDKPTADRREMEYAETDVGCYIYYFKFNNVHYAVDATAETGRFGRLLNHNKKGNCRTEKIEVDGLPHLILVAKRDIEAGEALEFDYGDWDRDTIKHYPWLA